MIFIHEIRMKFSREIDGIFVWYMKQDSSFHHMTISHWTIKENESKELSTVDIWLVLIMIMNNICLPFSLFKKNRLDLSLSSVQLSLTMKNHFRSIEISFLETQIKSDWLLEYEKSLDSLNEYGSPPVPSKRILIKRKRLLIRPFSAFHRSYALYHNRWVLYVI